MFHFLRKLIVPIIAAVLVLFVAMIILQWGLGFNRGDQFRSVEAAAVINGESVPWQAYNNLYNNLYQQALSKDTSLSESQEHEIQERAWGQLVHERLLAQQAEKNGIVVTDEEVYQYLRANPPPELQQVPQFQTDGKFDYQKYFTAMTSPELGSFWASVEPLVRTDLKKLKMQELIVQAAQVSESEVKDAFMALNEKIKVDAVLVTYDKFNQSQSTISDEELKAYYNANKEKYAVPERATLNIAMIQKTPSDHDWNVAYNKLKVIHDSIAAGADFAEMAKRYSDDGSKTDGGNLGWFTQGAMVPEFDHLSFSMKEGELSEPFRTQYGWHIILHHGYKEEKETPPGKTKPELVKRAHVSHILIKVFPSQETIDQAHQRLTAFLTDAAKGDFIAAAKGDNLLTHTTAPFAKGDNIQYLGKDVAAGMFALEHQVNEVSGIMENNSAVYVIQVGQKRPAGLASFDEVKEKAQIDALRGHLAAICHDTAQAIYASIQAGASLESAAKQHGVTYQQFDQITRMTITRPLSNDPQALGGAFGLTQIGEISKPVDFKQGTAIFKLIDRIVPDLTEYNTKRDSLYRQILNSRQQQVYSKWYENLVSDSKIVNNVEKSQTQDQPPS